MILMDSDWQSGSDLDSIRNSCDVFFGNLYIITIIIGANVEMWARQMVQIGRKLKDPKIDLESTNG